MPTMLRKQSQNPSGDLSQLRELTVYEQDARELEARTASARVHLGENSPSKRSRHRYEDDEIGEDEGRAPYGGHC